MFFFQAEDGIRALVRSRGLGDVYKRQALEQPQPPESAGAAGIDLSVEVTTAAQPGDIHRAVSYTHLTLPTSDLV